MSQEPLSNYPRQETKPPRTDGDSPFWGPVRILFAMVVLFVTLMIALFIAYVVVVGLD